VHRANFPQPDFDMLRRAYTVAEQMHRGQRRKSGEAYITHPLAVATILAELGVDTTTLAAALLHDTVEDTAYTLEQARTDFGAEVAHLVDGVTKLDKLYFGDAAEAETLRKMIVAAGQDVRVLVIKLADRLHNMRTLRHKALASQQRIARYTQELLIPLADRLGLHVISRELEDLVLGILDPQASADIARYVRTHRERQEYVRRVINTVRSSLREERIRGRVVDRPRHLNSIYQEAQAYQSRTGTDGELIYDDPPRIVVIVAGQMVDCYAALGVLHGMWRPVRGRFKDFIASPKFNMYQSLHTTVLGPEDKPLEVFFRTEHMHQVAEFGIVARLRSVEESAGDPSLDDLEWLRSLLDWQRDAADPAEFLDSLRCDLSDQQIQVFTPDGEVVPLPSSATPVDLAYTLSTSHGDQMIGARVNGRLSPLSTPLRDGDVIEVLTVDGDYPGPDREWLTFVKSPRARMMIAQWFDERAAVHGLTARIQAGRDEVAGELLRRDRSLVNESPLSSLARRLDYPDLEALYAAVGEGRLEAGDLVDRLIAAVDNPGAAEQLTGG
jgi:GTP pyrophosphokinase